MSVEPVETFQFSEPPKPEQEANTICIEMPDSEVLVKWGMTAGVVVAALVCILVPLSFSDLHYYEMGFARSKVSGSVDTSKVYTGGRYFLGISSEFKIFRADMHNESFEKVAIFNKEKLEVLFSFSLLYKLRPSHLKKLHDVYDVEYRPVIRSITLATVKGVATKFTVDEYRLERRKVREAFAAEVAKQLGGNCCGEDAKFRLPGCQPLSECTDPGLFVDLQYFHLHRVGITGDQESRYMKQVVESEREDTELYRQSESMESIKTTEQRDLINNKAKEVQENATSHSDLIKATADIDSKRITSNAANQGLQIIYNKLNITTEEHKKSMDYIRTLTESNDANLYVGFDYMVASKEP